MIVLDARGDRSKGIARSLRKLGVKASEYRDEHTPSADPVDIV